MSDYSFSITPDKSMWVLQMPKGKRLMGKGNPYKDSHLSKYLDELGRDVSKTLRPLMKKHRIYDEPVLLNADKSGFKFVKGDVAYETEAISQLLKQLVESYCYK